VINPKFTAYTRENWFC